MVLKLADDKQYRVTLKERATVLGKTLYPGRTYVLRGDVVKTILDQVEHAEPV